MHKRKGVLFTILLVLAGLRTLAAAPADAIEQTVMDNEKAVWEASKAKDAARFRELVADDARIVFPSGVLTRADYLKGLPDRTITDFRLTDFEALRPNPQTVILIYKASMSGTYRGKPFPPASVRESTVWVKRGGKWVAVLNQETAIAP